MVDGSLTQEMTTDISNELCSPFTRKVLVVLEINNELLHIRAILWAIRYIIQKSQLFEQRTLLTNLLFSFMLDHFNGNRRNMKHLTFFICTAGISLRVVWEVWQPEHYVTAWWMILSGFTTWRSVWPTCPGCPPVFFLDLSRRLCTFSFISPSEEGALWLFLEFFSVIF